MNSHIASVLTTSYPTVILKPLQRLTCPGEPWKSPENVSFAVPYQGILPKHYPSLLVLLIVGSTPQKCR